MDSESINGKLQELIIDLRAEKEEIDKQIQIHSDEILQAKNYLESLYEKEDTDVRFFSPRNVESQYKKDIDKGKQTIHSLEKDNQTLYRKRNVLNRRISALCDICNSMDHAGDFHDDISRLTGGSEMNDENHSGDISYVIRLMDKERKRIASELHDTVIQDLVHSLHKVELCTKYLDQDVVSAKLELASTEKYLRETIQKARNFICDLRPMDFDDFGFSKTLLNSIEELQKNTTMIITADVDELPKESSGKYIFFYRIAMELLRNAVFHSGGNRVRLSIKRASDQIIMTVSDDGHGFSANDNKDKHFGLELVKERTYLIGGTLHIDSTDQGTSVKVILNE